MQRPAAATRKNVSATFYQHHIRPSGTRGAIVEVRIMNIGYLLEMKGTIEMKRPFDI